MKVAVTGGSGAIGGYVCQELARIGRQVVSVDRVAPKGDVPFVEADLCDLEATRKALEGFDQIVHLAAIPHPYNDPADRVMGVNMAIAFNVFEAARKAPTMPRVINGCSESSTGFGIHERDLKPLYVPIDEKHPCWPHETYSLSKHFGEEIGAKYSLVYGLEVVSLRYVWVWLERNRKDATAIIQQSRAGKYNPGGWYGAHVAVRDVARACAAASLFQFPAAPAAGNGKYGPKYEAFFLAARNTFHPIATLDVLRKIYGDDMPEVRDPAYFRANPYASVFDLRKAEKLLGWTPKLDWHDLESWEM